MSYELKFRKSAFKEWQQLDSTVRGQFRKKLAERLVAPHIESARLSGMPSCYKIKLVASGYRLVYEVIENELVVLVIAVGRRDADEAYRKARERWGDA